jgi:hypothetical protein
MVIYIEKNGGGTECEHQPVSLCIIRRERSPKFPSSHLSSPSSANDASFLTNIDEASNTVATDSAALAAPMAMTLNLVAMAGLFPTLFSFVRSGRLDWVLEFVGGLGGAPKFIHSPK